MLDVLQKLYSKNGRAASFERTHEEISAAVVRWLSASSFDHLVMEQ